MEYLKTIGGVDYYQHDNKIFHRQPDGQLIKVDDYQKSVVKSKEGTIKDDPPENWYWNNPMAEFRLPLN